MKEHFDFMNLDLVFIDGLMLVHTSGKNQHAHTKLVPKIREILVRKPGRVQLPAPPATPSCNPWNISSEAATNFQRKGISFPKLKLKSFDPGRRNGRRIGQSMAVSNQECSDFSILLPP